MSFKKGITILENHDTTKPIGSIGLLSKETIKKIERNPEMLVFEPTFMRGKDGKVRFYGISLVLR